MFIRRNSESIKRLENPDNETGRSVGRKNYFLSYTSVNLLKWMDKGQMS